VLAPVRSAPFPVEDAIGNRVAAALDAALLRHDASHEELRKAIEACVDSLRIQGMTPEGVVITIKALLLHSANAAAPHRREHSLQAADYFNIEIVNWCVVAYFRRPSVPDQPG